MVNFIQRKLIPPFLYLYVTTFFVHDPSCFWLRNVKQLIVDIFQFLLYAIPIVTKYRSVSCFIYLLPIFTAFYMFYIAHPRPANDWSYFPGLISHNLCQVLEIIWYRIKLVMERFIEPFYSFCAYYAIAGPRNRRRFGFDPIESWSLVKVRGHSLKK